MTQRNIFTAVTSNVICYDDALIDWYTVKNRFKHNYKQFWRHKNTWDYNSTMRGPGIFAPVRLVLNRAETRKLSQAKQNPDPTILDPDR